MTNFKLLLGSTLTASIIFTGCGDDKATSTEHKTVEQTTHTAQPTTHTKEDVAVEKSKEAINAISKVVTSKIDEAKKAIKEQAPEVTKTVKKTIETVKAKIHNATAPTMDGSILYKVCAGCHGADASKKALGKSAVVKGWDTAKIETALNGYKNGTYGGAMKGIMKGQVAKLSTDDIKALANYISKL